MIRQMTIRDIPTVARGWVDEKAKTSFAQLAINWTVEGCATFLLTHIDNPTQLLLVIEEHGVIVGAAGASCYHEWLPPHPLIINEWMWWAHDRRSVVRLLNAMKAWGIQSHAHAIRYVLNVPGTSPTKFTETYRWEVLCQQVVAHNQAQTLVHTD